MEKQKLRDSNTELNNFFKRRHDKYLQKSSTSITPNPSRPKSSNIQNRIKQQHPQNQQQQQFIQNSKKNIKKLPQKIAKPQIPLQNKFNPTYHLPKMYQNPQNKHQNLIDEQSPISLNYQNSYSSHQDFSQIKQFLNKNQNNIQPQTSNHFTGSTFRPKNNQFLQIPTKNQQILQNQSNNINNINNSNNNHVIYNPNWSNQKPFQDSFNSSFNDMSTQSNYNTQFQPKNRKRQYSIRSQPQNPTYKTPQKTQNQAKLQPQYQINVNNLPYQNSMPQFQQIQHLDEVVSEDSERTTLFTSENQLQYQQQQQQYQPNPYQIQPLSTQLFPQHQPLNQPQQQQQQQQNQNQNLPLDVWKQALILIEKKELEKACIILLDYGDQIFLQRFASILNSSEENMEKLSDATLKRFMLKYTQIMKQNYIEKLCLNFYKDFLDQNTIRNVTIREQSQVLQTLQQKSNLKSKVGAQSRVLVQQFQKLNQTY